MDEIKNKYLKMFSFLVETRKENFPIPVKLAYNMPLSFSEWHDWEKEQYYVDVIKWAKKSLEYFLNKKDETYSNQILEVLTRDKYITIQEEVVKAILESDNLKAIAIYKKNINNSSPFYEMPELFVGNYEKFKAVSESFPNILNSSDVAESFLENHYQDGDDIENNPIIQLYLQDHYHTLSLFKTISMITNDINKYKNLYFLILSKNKDAVNLDTFGNGYPEYFFKFLINNWEDFEKMLSTIKPNIKEKAINNFKTKLKNTLYNFEIAYNPLKNDFKTPTFNIRSSRSNEVDYQKMEIYEKALKTVEKMYGE